MGVLQCLWAFNVNAFSHLVYLFKSNFWIILTIIGAAAIIAMSVKEEISDYVTEEQTII